MQTREEKLAYMREYSKKRRIEKLNRIRNEKGEDGLKEYYKNKNHRQYLQKQIACLTLYYKTNGVFHWNCTLDERQKEHIRQIVSESLKSPPGA